MKYRNLGYIIAVCSILLLIFLSLSLCSSEYAYTQDIIPVTVEFQEDSKSIEDIISTIEEISKILPEDRTTEEWQLLVGALIDLGKLQTNEFGVLVDKLLIKITKYNELIKEYEKNVERQERELEKIDNLYKQAELYNNEVKEIMENYSELITEYKTRKNLIGFGLGYGYNNTAHVDVSYYNTLWSFFMIGGGLWLDYDITNNSTSFGVKINLGIHF